MLNELLIKELSNKVDINASDIQKINDAEVYSTSEIKTNKKWIDGKPIYRKVIDMGMLPNTTNKSVNHNLSNFTMINVGGGAVNTTNNVFSPFSGFNDEVYVTSTHVIWGTKANRTTLHGYVILEYTKTTD